MNSDTTLEFCHATLKGTKVKLTDMEATMLNGLCGVVVTHSDERSAADIMTNQGKVMVLLDNGKIRHLPFWNIAITESVYGEVAVGGRLVKPITSQEAKEIRRSMAAKANAAGGGPK
jgi:hypothetical protein